MSLSSKTDSRFETLVDSGDLVERYEESSARLAVVAPPGWLANLLPGTTPLRPRRIDWG